MKSQTKIVTKRFISLLLVMLTLISVCSVGVVSFFGAADIDSAGTSANLSSDSLSSVGTSGVSGNSSLFDSIDSQEPYVRAEKTSYPVDTPVLVTADTYGMYPDAVLALYEGKDKSSLASTDKPSYKR